MSTENEPIAEILQRHKDEGLVQIGREALADAQATSLVEMDHDAIVTRATRLELALGYVLGVIDRICAERDALKAEAEQLRAVKRHLSERISTGQEGWNEIYREAEQVRVERDEAIVRADAQFKTRMEEVAERDALKAELAEARAAIERVRRLQELTISASCRAQAIEHARDTLTVLDAPQHPVRDAEQDAERYKVQQLGHKYWRVYDQQTGEEVKTFMGGIAGAMAQQYANDLNGESPVDTP